MKNPLKNILFSINGYYVELINGSRGPLYHVFCKGITHATCDSAYDDLECAISRCKYLEKELK